VRAKKHQSLNLSQPAAREEAPKPPAEPRESAPASTPESRSEARSEALPEVVLNLENPTFMEALEGDPPNSAELHRLSDERDQLAREKQELRDQLLRAQAEFQNFRRRVERERIEQSEYAATEAVRALLPILDDFERALKVESADAEYVKGMELIFQRLADSLKRLGLETLDPTGARFDPHMHHAVEMVETEVADDQTVLGVYQKGYNFKGRLLRAAMVKVAVAPATK
jgi:molecular chaperone GrpE